MQQPIADGVFVVDANQRITYWEDGLLGYSATDVLDRYCYQVIAGRVPPDEVLCQPNCKLRERALCRALAQSVDFVTHTKEEELVRVSEIVVSSAKRDLTLHRLRPSKVPQR